MWDVGDTVSLADYRGKNLLLYFNEDVGCDACFYQMAKLESLGALAKGRRKCCRS